MSTTPTGTELAGYGRRCRPVTSLARPTLGPARSPRRLRLVAAVMALAATSCDGTGRPAAALPSPMPEISVTMDEYRFDYDQTIPAGRVLFRTTNAGEAGHQLTLVPLDDDMPPIDEQLRGTERRAVAPVAQVRPRPPGAGGSFVVDLEPGRRYAMICFLRARDGQSHARKGMTAEFRTPPAD